MALNPKLSVASRNLALNAALDVLNTGYLRIYDGVQPATADTALSGNTLLAELTLAGTAFSAAASASKAAGAIGSDSSANATGTASFFRLFKSDGTTAVLDGSVGTASADLILNSVSIVAGSAVAVSALTITMAA